jgi:hypothetical protein
MSSASSGAIEPEPERPRAAVMCARCRALVDLSTPFKREGWHIVHECDGHRIEAFAARPGSSPWAWRAASAAET